MTSRLSWLPNAICVVRILLIAPLVWALLGERYMLALALIVIAGASDGVDGFLAKTFDWRTRLGSLLDPAADKLLLISVFVSLTVLGLVPFAVTAIVILRDAVIIAGALTYQFLIGSLRGEPTLISKLNTACQLGFTVCTVAAAAFDWALDQALQLLGAAVVFTSINSGLTYVLDWSRRARAARRRSSRGTGSLGTPGTGS
jgi:cardiolipin synthase (CMP-forming)